MAFKRNEPGCRCCGFGLTGNLGDNQLIICTPSTGSALMGLTPNKINYANIASLGSSTVTVGASPEEGKILVQKTDGSIWSIEAKTHTVTELWDSSTDIANHNVERVIFQKNYNKAAVVTTNGPPIQEIVVDSTGSYLYGPVNSAVEPDYLTVSGTQYTSIFVDSAGDLFAGRAYTGSTLDAPDYRLYITMYKNGTSFATSTVKRYSTNPTITQMRGLEIGWNQIVYLDSTLITTGTYYGAEGSAPPSNYYRTYDMTAGGEITISDQLWEHTDVHGRSTLPNLYNPLPMSLNDTQKDTCDIPYLNLGWYRINKSLSTNIELLVDFNPKDLLVMYPST